VKGLEPTLESLEISFGSGFLPNQEIANLSRFEQLNNLRIEGLAANDEALRLIFQYALFIPLITCRKCKKLERLSINGAALTEVTLQEIPLGIACLELDYSSHLTPKSMDILCKLRNLKKLSLRGCTWVTSKNLPALSTESSKLERIVLSTTSLSPTFIAKLEQLLPYTEIVIQ
jgi:hypothetical protein